MKTNLSCKICGGESIFFVSVDAGQHCNKQIDEEITNSGASVEYFRCEECEFIFSTYIDSFTNTELVELIYNDDYVNFDPLYPRIRPEINARFLASIIEDAWMKAGVPSVLDYGAGNGLLSTLLEHRVQVVNYDALNPLFDHLPAQRFDIVFCAEVVEHVPTPHTLLTDWCKLTADTGCIIFSTTTVPDDIAALGGTWWYMGPRNGHVSLFSRKSLHVLCALHGLRYAPIDDQWHLAYRDSSSGLDCDAVRSAAARLPKGFLLV